MLLTAFYNFVINTLNFFVSLFPNADNNTLNLIVSGMITLRGLISRANFFLDVQQFFAILTVVVATESIILVMRITKWILHNLSLGFFKK